MADLIYTTRSGDTWDQIARRVYGAERYMDVVIAANPDENYTARFDAGTDLMIPELPAADVRAESLPPWREA
jgi:phage tail protein X